jgi:hypothetical protein
MSYARNCTNKPIGFVAGARLFHLKPGIEYRTQELLVSVSQTKAKVAKTDYVVVSPGVNGTTKVFPATSTGHCLSWLHIGDGMPGNPGPAAVLKSLGYTLN